MVDQIIDFCEKNYYYNISFAGNIQTAYPVFI